MRPFPPKREKKTRPSFDPTVDRAEPLGQAETAGRAGIMAIDIVRTGLGIGTNLTPSSLFGKKLSTQRPLTKFSRPHSLSTPPQLHRRAPWTPDFGRALMRSHDRPLDRSAIALMAIGRRSNGLAVRPACGGPCCRRGSCCVPGSGGHPGSCPGPEAGAGGGARAHAGGGSGANAGGGARAHARGGPGADAGGGSAPTLAAVPPPVLTPVLAPTPVLDVWAWAQAGRSETVNVKRMTLSTIASRTDIAKHPCRPRQNPQGALALAASKVSPEPA